MCRRLQGCGRRRPISTLLAFLLSCVLIIKVAQFLACDVSDVKPGEPGRFTQSLIARNKYLEDTAAKWSSLIRSADDELHHLKQLSGGRKAKQFQRRQSGLKIYVYELPAYFNSKNINSNHDCDPDAPETWQTKYATEVIIHRRLLQSPLRTLDPAEADLFYVPVYHCCYIHGRATQFIKGYQLLLEAYIYIRQKHSYWNRTMGRDHVWTFAHDIGGCVAPFDELRHSIWITTSGEKMPRAKAFANYTKMYEPYYSFVRNLEAPCYDPWKDVVMPPLLSDPLLVDARTTQKVVAKRSILASFRGTVLRDYTYSRGIRQRWYMQYSDDDRLQVTFVGPQHEKEPNYKFLYFHDMRTSTFCLCPPGWASWTPRVFEALLLGCIPVVVTDGNQLPFESRTPYEQFTVFVPEADAARVKQILLQIPQSRVEEMQRYIDSDIWRRFVYDKDSEENDAFDYIMLELEDRMQALQKHFD